MKATLVVFLVVSLFTAFQQQAVAVGDSRQTKEFDEYKCKLTLPSAGCEWFDEKKIPHATAVFSNEADVLLVMAVSRNEEGFPINNEFIRGFDNGFFKSGNMSKTSSEITSFRGVPCYEFHVRAHDDNSVMTCKVFAANGYVYQLQVFGSPLPVKERDKLEPFFESFEFIGKPVPPAEKTEAHKLGYKAGKIAAYAIMGVVVLGILKMIRRKS